MIRNYEIKDITSDEGAKTILQMHIDTLISFRRKTRYPDELEWEIRLYKFMQEDPAARLSAYHRVRFHDGVPEKQNHPPLEKREVVKILGWEVP